MLYVGSDSPAWPLVDDEVVAAIRDRGRPVIRWVTPDEFAELREEAETIGFAAILSGPLVRSSYRAGRLDQQALDTRAAGRP